MNAIHTDNAPAAIGPYSQAIEVNGFVFASGQIPIDPATGNFEAGSLYNLINSLFTYLFVNQP